MSTQTRMILGWLRRLVPAALLVLSAVNATPPVPQDVVVLDEDEVMVAEYPVCAVAAPTVR